MKLTQNENLLLGFVQHGHLALVKEYLNKGISIECRESLDGKTPLIIAASHGHLDVVQFLVKEGAKVDAVGKNGCSALYLAALNAHVEVVNYLLSKGANIHLKGPQNTTALDRVTQEIVGFNQLAPLDEEKSKKNAAYNDIRNLLLNNGLLSKQSRRTP
jgi:ankyrin repeat protein